MKKLSDRFLEQCLIQAGCPECGQAYIEQHLPLYAEIVALEAQLEIIDPHINSVANSAFTNQLMKEQQRRRESRLAEIEKEENL